jgi:hypothetical protein
MREKELKEPTDIEPPFGDGTGDGNEIEGCNESYNPNRQVRAQWNQ